VTAADVVGASGPPPPSRRTQGRREAAQLSGRARRKGLTPGRRRALATLMHAKRHDRPCTATNMTTAPDRWATMPLFVHHAAADWLVSEAYATGSLMAGQDHIALTATGVYLAEQEGL
jgi:hypothetical protein